MKYNTIDDLINKTDILDTCEIKRYHKETGTVGSHKIKKIRSNYSYIKYKTTDLGNYSLVVDDKEYNKGMLVSSLYDFVSKEVEKYGKRTKNTEEYGFDTKFASHLFRLYYEGIELMAKGTLTFPFIEEKRKFMIDIKKGKYKLGVIFNLDEHYKSGSHWVALYADLNKDQVYFFDSYGKKPEKRIRKLKARERRSFLKKVLGLICAILPSYFYLRFEANWIEVTKKKVLIPKLSNQTPIKLQKLKISNLFTTLIVHSWCASI